MGPKGNIGKRRVNLIKICVSIRVTGAYMGQNRRHWHRSGVFIVNFEHCQLEHLSIW